MSVHAAGLLLDDFGSFATPRSRTQGRRSAVTKPAYPADETIDSVREAAFALFVA